MLFPWKCEVSIKGITPLLIHNGRTANPLDEYAKRMKNLTSKRKKTEEDIKELLALQWESGLYWDQKLGLHMPTENILAALHKACKKHKMGPLVPGFVFDEAIGFPIIVPHHTDFEALKADESNRFIKTVTIQRSKTLSCRPMFNDWSIGLEFFVDETLLSLEDVKLILTTMASRIGLGVWTPSHPKPGNFGRFLIKKLEFINMKTGEKKGFKNDAI